MKKLMIAAAAVAVGFAAQAATIAWSSGGIQITGDFDQAEGDMLNKGLVYLVDSSYTKEAILAAVQGAADDAARESYLAGISYDNKVTGADGSFAKSFEAGDVDSFQARLVMFDASTIGGSEYFMISDIYAATMSKAMNYFDYDAESYVNALDYATAGQAGSNWQAVNVPEPTSGLLLLLGMAGLALRRRRA